MIDARVALPGHIPASFPSHVRVQRWASISVTLSGAELEFILNRRQGRGLRARVPLRAPL